MKMVYPNLHKRMTEQGIDPDDLARCCGVTRLSIMLKLSGFLPWKFTEVLQICSLFGITDAESLFVRLDIIS